MGAGQNEIGGGKLMRGGRPKVPKLAAEELPPVLVYQLSQAAARKARQHSAGKALSAVSRPHQLRARAADKLRRT